MDALRCILAAVLIFMAVSSAVCVPKNQCLKVYTTVGNERRSSNYRQRYTVSCGWCGTQRCTRYRQATRYYYSRRVYTNSRYECCSGWRRDRYGDCSMAICSPSCRAGRGLCVRPNVCLCNPGYYGRQCQYDEDECKGNNQCNQICINTVGSYRCECNSGYRLASDGRGCENIDECSMSRTQDCQHRCVDTPGSYNCQCYHGYKLLPNGKECENENECIGMEHNCDQICIDNQGSFMCNCTMGYELEGFHNCSDIDECQQEDDDCDHWCVNTVGSFNCTCRNGYELGMDGKTCLDVDECAPRMNCDMIKICTVTGQSSNCSYVSGHFINTTECAAQFGADICSNNDHNCTDLQVCQMISDKLVCVCIESEGHALTETGLSTGGTLSTNQTLIRRCEKGELPWNCTLYQGYQLVIDNTFCEAGIKHNCTEMQSCRNTVGGYECPCKDGYLQNNDTQECDDIDECSTDYMNCPEGQVQICRTSSSGAIQCECVQGSVQECRGDNCDLCGGGVRVCRDENTCTCHGNSFLNADNKPCEGGGCGEMIHDCTEMETCVNTIGGYNCPCMAGYIRDDVSGNCTDVNECHDETAPCTHFCMNKEGTYACTCVEGYKLDADNATCVMRMGVYDAYMALSLEDGLDEPVEFSYTLGGSSQGWLFPVGMICGIAIIAFVVIGRKKSDRIRRGTDVPLNAMLSLQRRITRSSSSGGRPSNVYSSTPQRDPMDDNTVYSPNTVAEVRSSRVSAGAVMIDDIDVYQVPTASNIVGNDTLESTPKEPDIGDGDDEPHYLFEKLGGPDSIPINDGGPEVYESYNMQPAVLEQRKTVMKSAVVCGRR